MSKPDKHAPASPQSLQFPVWLAFVSAGLCFVAAGYLGSTDGGWRRLLELRGVSLPMIVEFVISFPVALPLAHVAAGLGLLGLSRVRVRSAVLNQSLSAFSSVAAVVAGLLACSFVYANVLVFEELSRALQQ